MVFDSIVPPLKRQAESETTCGLSDAEHEPFSFSHPEKGVQSEQGKIWDGEVGEDQSKRVRCKIPVVALIGDWIAIVSSRFHVHLDQHRRGIDQSNR